MFEETLCWHQRQRKACQLVYRHRHGHELLLPWQERGEWEVSKDSRIRNLKTQEWLDLHVSIYVKIRGPEIHQFLTIEFYRTIYQTFEGHFGAFLTKAGAKLYVTAIACLAYGAWTDLLDQSEFGAFRCLSVVSKSEKATSRNTFQLDIEVWPSTTSWYDAPWHMLAMIIV